MSTELTTAERLFMVRYSVIIPAYATNSRLSELKIPIPTSTNSTLAQVELDYPTHVNYPISRLATLSDSGVQITLCKPIDAVAMYKAIQEHIAAWRKAADEDVHRLDIPVSELECLNRFAGILQPIARQGMASEIKVNITNNKFINYIHKRSGMKSNVEERIERLPTEARTEMDDLTKVASERMRRRNRTR